jgi:hypothetical protein
MAEEARNTMRAADAAQQRRSRQNNQAQRRRNQADELRRDAADNRGVFEQRETRRQREAAAQWARILRASKECIKVRWVTTTTRRIQSAIGSRHAPLANTAMRCDGLASRPECAG